MLLAYVSGISLSIIQRMNERLNLHKTPCPFVRYPRTLHGFFEYGYAGIF